MDGFRPHHCGPGSRGSAVDQAKVGKGSISERRAGLACRAQAGWNEPANANVLARGNKETTHVSNPDRISDARRRHCIDGRAARQSPISRSRSARARVIKGDVDAAPRHPAYGGGPEADDPYSRRSDASQFRVGFPIPRPTIARRQANRRNSRRPSPRGSWLERPPAASGGN
jgi:hypothetical protein